MNALDEYVQAPFIVKEIFSLNRCRFVLGVFVSFFRENEIPFDVCFANGVLCHMRNPCELIHLISKASKKVVIWTHYYDNDLIEANDIVAGKFSGTLANSYKEFDHVLHKYVYGDAAN